MQVKTTMRYHPTPVNIAIINKSTNNKFWREYKEGNFFVLLVGMHIGASIVERSMEITQKIKSESAFDQAIPLLRIYLKKLQTLIQKNIRTAMFIAVLFTISNIWNQSKCPSVGEWIKQQWGIYTMV